MVSGTWCINVRASGSTIFTNQVVMIRVRVWLVGLLVTAAIVARGEGVKSKKSVLDYNDADVERIFRELEVSIDS